MAITFALRGTSKTPYYSAGISTYTDLGAGSIIDAGAGTTGKIGANVINMDQGAWDIYGLVYRGERNLPTGQQMSILMRVAFGSTTDANELFYIGGAAANSGNQSRISGAGNLVSTFNQKSTGVSLATKTQAWAPTIGTFYDIVFLLDGSLTTGAFVCYVDGSVLGTGANFSATRPAPASLMHLIMLGVQDSNSFAKTRLWIDEVVIFDTIITPGSIALTSGTGSLNGASRTAYVSATAFNGDSIDPGTTHVENGVNYVFGGIAKTGSAILSAKATTKVGVTANDGTGLYDGSERYTDFGNSNIKSGQSGKYNATSNNRTGTLVAAAKASTKIGVTADDGPGEYDGSDRWSAPDDNDLRAGIQLKNNSTSLNLTGTMIANTAEDTKHGVESDGGTGLYDGSDLNDAVAADELKHGVSKLQAGATVVGEYRGYDLWEAVGSAQLLFGITKLQDGTSVSGTLEGSSPPSTVREISNAILKFIGEPTLTDDEYGDLTLTLSSTPTETYVAMAALLDSRESVSNSKDRLKHYFQAKGVPLDADPEISGTDSEILIGARLDDLIEDDEAAKSNIFIGGVIE